MELNRESLFLSERVFNCEHCNFSCDRDLNAALNLAMAGSSPVSACGLDNADGRDVACNVRTARIEQILYGKS